MKIIAAVLNIALLGFLAPLILENGFPGFEDSEFYLTWIAFLAPIFNLLYLFSSGKENNWLSLYLKRKALEEQKKIDQMNS